MKNTKEEILRHIDTLAVDTHHFPGTTYTVAVLKNPMNGFVIAQGVSSIVPNGVPFDAQKGIDFAVADAKKKAFDFISDLERYAEFSGL